jgi:hypothetical protein
MTACHARRTTLDQTPFQADISTRGRTNRGSGRDSNRPSSAIARRRAVGTWTVTNEDDGAFASWIAPPGVNPPTER